MTILSGCMRIMPYLAIKSRFLFSGTERDGVFFEKMMKNNWKKVKLGDILEKIIGGGTPSRVVADFWNGDIFWATVKDMKDGVYKLSETQERITEQGVKSSATNIISKNTVIISTRMGLGRCFINKVEMAINQDLKALIPNKNVDVNFLLWLLVSKTKEIEVMGTGTTVKGIRLEELRNIEIIIPERIEDQKKIAEILSGYDDLIENNNRRIKILEEMAQAIYKQWFVDFKFPGYEKVKMVDSSAGEAGGELGSMPEGWEIKRIEDVIETIGGGTPSKEKVEYWNSGAIQWFTPTDLTSNKQAFIFQSSLKINELGLKKSSAKLFPAFSVMMTSRATIGEISINIKPASTNQGFITCIPNEFVSVYQLYFWLKENKDLIISLSGGATFKEINKSTFRNLLITVPELETRRTFMDAIEPIFSQMKNIQLKNNNLRKTRDLLLPKLMNGLNLDL